MVEMIEIMISCCSMVARVTLDPAWLIVIYNWQVLQSERKIAQTL
jgi:hypothetical protein